MSSHLGLEKLVSDIYMELEGRAAWLGKIGGLMGNFFLCKN
jgi:hypothetical protein